MNHFENKQGISIECSFQLTYNRTLNLWEYVKTLLL